MSDSAAQALYVLRGRDKPFDEPGEYFEATIKVRMQTVTKYARVEDDLRCVAERAVHAAASAYNLANTRITAVRLERIEPDAAEILYATNVPERLREIAESIVDVRTEEGRFLLKAADDFERLQRLGARWKRNSQEWERLARKGDAT